MKMPPVARKAYMTFVLVAVAAYIIAMGYRGVRWIQQKQEHSALTAGPSIQFLTDLAPAIERHTATHHGALPRDIPLTELLGPDAASSLAIIEQNPDARVQWNAAITDLTQTQNARFTILWIDDPRYPDYIAALTTTGQPPFTAEILPRALQPDTAHPAPLRP